MSDEQRDAQFEKVRQHYRTRKIAAIQHINQIGAHAQGTLSDAETDCILTEIAQSVEYQQKQRFGTKTRAELAEELAAVRGRLDIAQLSREEALSQIEKFGFEASAARLETDRANAEAAKYKAAFEKLVDDQQSGSTAALADQLDRTNELERQRIDLLAKVAELERQLAAAVVAIDGGAEPGEAHSGTFCLVCGATPEHLGEPIKHAQNCEVNRQPATFKMGLAVSGQEVAEVLGLNESQTAAHIMPPGDMERDALGHLAPVSTPTAKGAGVLMTAGDPPADDLGERPTVEQVQAFAEQNAPPTEPAPEPPNPPTNETEEAERLGRIVRQAWVDWAHMQPTKKATWLARWEELPEPLREVDRRIGKAVAAYVRALDAMRRQPPQREPLPSVRYGLTHKFSIQGFEGYLTGNEYPDGRLGEMFVTMAKEGSTVGGLIDALSRLISLALQWGCPVADLAKHLKDAQFSPQGATTNPEIPFAQSIVDYLGQWMLTNYVDKPAAQSPKE